MPKKTVDFQRGRSRSYVPINYTEDNPPESPHTTIYKRKRTAAPAFFCPDEDDELTPGELAPAFIGRVAAYCTADSYNLGKLHDHFKKKGLIPISSKDHVLVEIKGSTGVVVFFNYGVVVMWGLTIPEERDVLAESDTFRVSPASKVEVDDLEYTYGDEAKIHNDRIILDNTEALTKLGLAYAIAQSTRLSNFEDSVEHIIEETRGLPLEMAKTGKVSLGRAELSRRLARLFIEKSNINLHSGITEAPAFIWSHCLYDRYYTMARSYLEIQTRAKTLNHRVVVLQELFDMLREESHNRSTQRQEWVVIALIVTELSFLAAEFVLGFLKNYLH